MYNKAVLVGRLGKDPDLSYTQAGTARCRFSIATSDFYYDKKTDEKKEETEWHNVITWGKSAENCGKYLVKGKLVLVEGKIVTRSWDDEKTGQKRYITEIKAFLVRFLGSDGQKQKGDGNRGNQGNDRDDRGQGSGNQGSGGGGGQGGRPDNDPIPF